MACWTQHSPRSLLLWRSRSADHPMLLLTLWTIVVGVCAKNAHIEEKKWEKLERVGKVEQTPLAGKCQSFYSVPDLSNSGCPISFLWASTAAYANLGHGFCSSTVLPWPFPCACTDAFSAALEKHQGATSANLTKEKRELVSDSVALLLTGVELLKLWASLSHWMGNLSSRLEVQDRGSFSLDEVKLPWSGALAVFLSHPELFLSI